VCSTAVGEFFGVNSIAVSDLLPSAEPEQETRPSDSMVRIMRAASFEAALDACLAALARWRLFQRPMP
jgi:hypothetical protein